jgi:hypothetical protein
MSLTSYQTAPSRFINIRTFYPQCNPLARLFLKGFEKDYPPWGRGQAALVFNDGATIDC